MTTYENIRMTALERIVKSAQGAAAPAAPSGGYSPITMDQFKNKAMQRNWKYDSGKGGWTTAKGNFVSDQDFRNALVKYNRDRYNKLHGIGQPSAEEIREQQRQFARDFNANAKARREAITTVNDRTGIERGREIANTGPNGMKYHELAGVNKGLFYSPEATNAFIGNRRVYRNYDIDGNPTFYTPDAKSQDYYGNQLKQVGGTSGNNGLVVFRGNTPYRYVNGRLVPIKGNNGRVEVAGTTFDNYGNIMRGANRRRRRSLI